MILFESIMKWSLISPNAMETLIIQFGQNGKLFNSSHFFFRCPNTRWLVRKCIGHSISSLKGLFINMVWHDFIPTQYMNGSIEIHQIYESRVKSKPKTSNQTFLIFVFPCVSRIIHCFIDLSDVFCVFNPILEKFYLN